MKPRILVTGATGFLGDHVVDQLLDAGAAVHMLARSHGGRSRQHEARGARFFAADLARRDTLRMAADGVDAILHLAGRVSRDPRESHAMMRLHVEGTRAVLEVARELAIGRVVVASTSGTRAVGKEARVRDESDGYATSVIAGWPYYASKLFQEKLAFQLGQELSLDVVCVNPSLLLGPGDHRLSSTGDVQKFLRGQLPIIPPGGLSFVDVRDAAEATIAAARRGRPGEAYLLASANWSFAEFFGRLERIAKRSGPRLRLPGGLARAGAAMIEHAYRHHAKAPPITRDEIEMSEHYWYCSAAKAARELGFAPRDPGLTLADTVHYLRSGHA